MHSALSSRLGFSALLFELIELLGGDDAVLAGVSTARIIHGKGTGALRAALWRYFKADKRIKSYRHGEYGEGDAGVTVIEINK